MGGAVSGVCNYIRQDASQQKLPNRFAAFVFDFHSLYIREDSVRQRQSNKFVAIALDFHSLYAKA